MNEFERGTDWTAMHNWIMMHCIATAVVANRSSLSDLHSRMTVFASYSHMSDVTRCIDSVFRI